MSELVGFASKGTTPRFNNPCLAARSPRSTQRMLFCCTRGMTSETMGMFGRYLLTRRAVRPVLVNTTIIAAPVLLAARTAEDASASDWLNVPLSTIAGGSCVW